MKPRFRVLALVFVGGLSVSGSGWAQTKDKPPLEKRAPEAGEFKGTAVKGAPVVSDDPITKLAETPAQKTQEHQRPGL